MTLSIFVDTRNLRRVVSSEIPLSTIIGTGPIDGDCTDETSIPIQIESSRIKLTVNVKEFLR